MPSALITTKPNEERSIEVEDVSDIQGWYRLGIWQWLAWNRLKFLYNLLVKCEARERRLMARRRDRESQRSYLRHCDHLNVFRLWAALALWASEHRSAGIIEYARKKLGSRSTSIQFLKPPPCFIRGLQGFARTDLDTALANN
ncbi:hypothetical protein QUB05_31450 [Microcoleus sp. F10-C6]|uniref:hypothetical protein n=1 Tax=unclassified Microcoleus TaxID=2642155 RepID=UPI002FD391E1